MTDATNLCFTEATPHEQDDFFIARLTPIGRGGVSSLGVSGSEALNALARRVRLGESRESPRNSFFEYDRPFFAYFKVDEGKDEGIYEEVVLRRRGYFAYEIDCHGGEFVTTRIIEFFVRSGARTLEPDKWERKLEREEANNAVQHNRMLTADSGLVRGTLFGSSNVLEELFFSKISSLIARVSSEETARIALDQRRALRLFFENLGSDLSVLVSSAFGRALELESQITDELDEVLIHRAWGRRLFEPFVVSLLGAPNVGKSSLFNALLGYERSVVSPEAGTTRDLVGATALINGWLFRFVDAAGLRNTTDRVERVGIENARQFSRVADVALYCYDAGVPQSSQVSFETREGLDKSFASNLEILKVLNKSDLLDAQSDSEWSPDFVRVSARLRSGLERLTTLIYEHTVGKLKSTLNTSVVRPILWTPEQIDFVKALRNLCGERRYNEALTLLGTDDRLL